MGTQQGQLAELFFNLLELGVQLFFVGLLRWLRGNRIEAHQDPAN